MASKKRVHHDWAGALGGGYQCTCCRRYLEENNEGSNCPGLTARTYVARPSNPIWNRNQLPVRYDYDSD